MPASSWLAVLLCRGAGDDGADVVDHDDCLEEFHADQVADRDGGIAYGFKLAGDLFSGRDTEFDFLTDLSLEDAGDGIPGLQGEPGIREERGCCGEAEGEEAECFHGGSV